MLHTARLVLRKHDLDDFAALHAMWGEPAVYRHIAGRASTREESWARLLRYCGHWSLLGFGYWAIEDQATRAYVGEMGFADYHRDIDPSLDDRPEMGWILSPAAHGKGYATEALMAIAGWGDAHLGARETVCMISPENAASIRVAEKIGFRETLRTTYKGDPVIIFHRKPKA